LLVPAGEEAELLGRLPVRKFPGIGPVAEQKLHALGLITLGDLAAASPAQLRRVFGAWTESIRRGCIGRGAHELGRERPAFQEHDPEGCVAGRISNERTFREDVRDPACIDAMLCSLCERVCWRARKRGIKARTVTLELRYADFQTLSRSRTVSPTNSELELYPVVRDLFDAARRRRLAIRLLGIALSNLGSFDQQLPLFAEDEALSGVIDDVRRRYGYGALGIALSQRRKEGESAVCGRAERLRSGQK
jgi:DNA polymerase IV